MSVATPAKSTVQRTPLYRKRRANPLRVVLVGPSQVPSWIATLFELARDHGDVDLQALVADIPADPSPRRLPLDLRLFLWVERALLRTYLRLCRRSLEGPLSPVSLPMQCRVDSTFPEPTADPHAIRSQLEAMQVDLVLLYGPRAWAGILADSTEYGCWVLDGDLTDPVHAGAALVAPILAREIATPLVLELNSPESEGNAVPEVLATSWGATRAVSFNQHRDLAMVKLPSLLLRAFRQLPETPARRVANLQVGPSASNCGFGAGMRAVLIAAKLALQSRSRRIAVNQPWFVLLPEPGEAMDLKAPSLGACRYLLAPQPDYWADPFLMEHSGQLLLFVEQYVDACKRGVIVCIRLDADGTATKLGVALDEPFHLSYPQIFRWQDAWYMTVESCDANRVSLYRAEDFPLRWVHESDLIHGRVCVDPTLEYHDGRWYLFANVSESGGNPSDELFLFVADALHGPYLPHPANPVSVDVRNARPAGRLFRRDGCLFRPAQCCAPEYGSAVVFNEVLELSPDHYVERAVSRLAPYWSEQLDGCHTYNATGNQEVLDAHGQPPSMAMRIRVTESDQV